MQMLQQQVHTLNGLESLHVLGYEIFFWYFLLEMHTISAESLDEKWGSAHNLTKQLVLSCCENDAGIQKEYSFFYLLGYLFVIFI